MNNKWVFFIGSEVERYTAGTSRVIGEDLKTDGIAFQVMRKESMKSEVNFRQNLSFCYMLI